MHAVCHIISKLGPIIRSSRLSFLVEIMSLDLELNPKTVSEVLVLFSKSSFGQIWTNFINHFFFFFFFFFFQN